MKDHTSLFALPCTGPSRRTVIGLSQFAAGFPTIGKAMRFPAATLIMVSILAGCTPVEELEPCVLREPGSNDAGAVGYELIDLMTKEVWATSDFTEEEFAALSLPLFWQKNDPRIMVGDQAEFLQSPGCSEPGRFTYMQAFDKEFVKVVQLDTIDEPVDSEGLIRRTELEKHHVLTYVAGRTVHILENPDGERFIWVSMSADRASDTFALPEGWTLSTHVLQADLQVELSGNVSVLRMENEDSYQGPLSDGIAF
jgi:hypothetical protein